MYMILFFDGLCFFPNVFLQLKIIYKSIVFCNNHWKIFCCLHIYIIIKLKNFAVCVFNLAFFHFKMNVCNLVSCLLSAIANTKIFANTTKLQGNEGFKILNQNYRQ